MAWGVMTGREPLSEHPDLRGLVARTPFEQLPELVGELAAAWGAALARLAVPINHVAGRTEEPDKNVSAHEAAARLGVSKVYLYRNASKLPFARRIGRRVVFSARGLEKWSRDQRARV